MTIMDCEQLQSMDGPSTAKARGHMFLFLCDDAISRREQLTGGWSDQISMTLSRRYTGVKLCQHL